MIHALGRLFSAFIGSRHRSGFPCRIFDTEHDRCRIIAAPRGSPMAASWYEAEICFAGACCDTRVEYFPNGYTSMPVTLYYLDDSRAIRALWLLEALKLPYTPKLYKKNPATLLAPPELANVHPSGNAPLVEDGGIVYAESGNILEHLTAKYGKDTDLIWKNAEEENTIKYALYAAESNIMIAGFMLGIHRMAVRRLPYGLSAIVGFILSTIDSYYAKGAYHKALINLQSQIDRNDGFYCNGRLTVADIMYYGTIVCLLKFGLRDTIDEQYPGLAKWLQNLKEIPSFNAAKEKERELDARARALS